MCLEKERASRAKPETEVVGYVVMRRGSRGSDSLWSRYCDATQKETSYKLNKWYKAKYLPKARASYDQCNKTNPPGFHAYRTLNDAIYERYPDQTIVLATFKGVISYGSDIYGNRCFRAMHRRLDRVLTVREIYENAKTT